MKPRVVTKEAARRIAVRAQLLDGSATDLLDTVRKLGFLQIDPIAIAARPQDLVPFSRLGPFDTGELDKLLWEDRVLFEYDAFIYPIESLPVIRARMKWHRTVNHSWNAYRHQFIAANADFRRYILRTLEKNGPLLGRDLEDRSAHKREAHRWWGTRQVGLMLDMLHVHGEIAVVGRHKGHRLWDIPARWFPETETIPWSRAEKLIEDQTFKSLGVRWNKGVWEAHPDIDDSPVPDRATLLSPFDRLIHDRKRMERLFDFQYRLEMYVPPTKREYGYYVLPLLVGDQLVGRAEPRFDRKSKVLSLRGAWGDTSRLPEALADFARFRGATDIVSEQT